jgi:hypothetical protein
MTPRPVRPSSQLDPLTLRAIVGVGWVWLIASILTATVFSVLRQGLLPSVWLYWIGRFDVGTYSLSTSALVATTWLAVTAFFIVMVLSEIVTRMIRTTAHPMLSGLAVVAVIIAMALSAFGNGTLLPSTVPQSGLTAFWSERAAVANLRTAVTFFSILLPFLAVITLVAGVYLVRWARRRSG